MDADEPLHPCPICATPTPGGPRYPRAVCGTCGARATDSAGTQVVGYNVSMSGGFAAYHRKADGSAGDLCAEVTDRGRCWIDGNACSIGEARFGGVVIEA